jgi:signal transduction histidine kinase
MKRSIVWVFILMSVCVAGITALQLYYSYKSYAVESAAFERNSNEALNQAVDSTFQDRHNAVLKKLRGWLNDTAFVTISCKWNHAQKVTVFKIKQVVPSPEGQNEISMSLDYFTERADSLTPKARELFLNHMVDYVGTELKKGYVWFYTQKLGDSLNKAAYSDPLDRHQIRKRYRQMLGKKGIDLPFLFNLKKHPENSISTKKVNIAVGRPKKEEWIEATFIDTNVFLLKQMRRLLAGSVGLFAILLVCFWYTIKTLLSQQKLSALKDDFISNMTHEIHTPLTSITVTAQALRQFSLSPVEQENYLDIILYQTDKLNILADEILSGARLGNGNEVRETVLANKFLEATVCTLGENKSRIDFAPCPDITISIYKSYLSRAIINLFDNALKYSDGQVLLLCKPQKNGFQISVADNGPGIASQFRTKVFDKFYRIPTGNTHNIKGYGLGLAYVKKVAEMHGGNITIADNVSGGTIFTLTVPL